MSSGHEFLVEWTKVGEVTLAARVQGPLSPYAKVAWWNYSGPWVKGVASVQDQSFATEEEAIRFARGLFQ